jgi:hypothetical protein
VRFAKNLSSFSGILILLIWVLISTTDYRLVHPYVWFILVFFIFITAVTYYVTWWGAREDEGNFQLYFFASMGFRLILSIGVIFIYVLLVKERQIQFVLNFFVLYFLYTAFEIYSLLTNLRPHSKKRV